MGSERLSGQIAWVKWERFALLMAIEGRKEMVAARFMFRRTAIRIAGELSVLKGIDARVLDTKTGEIIERERERC